MLKTVVAGGMSACKNTRGVPVTQRSLPQIQGSVYANQRENLSVAAVGWGRKQIVSQKVSLL